MLSVNPISYTIYWLTGIPESTARLLITVILAYPVAVQYNSLYMRHPKETTNTTTTTMDRNTFVLLSGLALSFFFNGFEIYHSLLTVGLSYGICYMVGEQWQQRRLAGSMVWVLNAVYLLAGYYYTSSEDYDISWTMPQCILCLRLMGFAFDYMDGVTKLVPTTTTIANNPQPMSFDADTALSNLPPPAQVGAYCFFPAAFLVGPQFSFSLYRRWVDNPLFLGKQVTDWDETYKGQQRYMVRCILLAILYLGLQQLVGAAFTSSSLLSHDYQQLPFLQRCWHLLVTGKFVYGKYIGIWLLTEGACVLFGITYDGEDKEGRARFGGLANTLPLKYETATSIDDIIGSFNINTNMWVKYYVFKRLKFLGNKHISQAASLFFLAIWHGFHLNYFITFTLEFFYTQCEAVFRRRLSPSIRSLAERNPLYFYLWTAFTWSACSITINYAVIGFDILKVSKAWTAYKSVYFIGHLLIPLILAGNKLLPPKYVPVRNRNKKLA
ncbi:MBOAT, membrane-bound O-acyltransferase family-domain-containing protein [Chlamydoabsidia padenii]|nr:MBOAT, membrane-bound O-acyltransferase family-domain-containing protein [Chlamydoabsidia padenii]